MKLAVSSPSFFAYSETFIRVQMERLPCTLRIYGGPVANETIPGGPIAPMRNIFGCIDTVYHRGLRRQGWEGPQTAELERRLRRLRINVLLANYGHAGANLLSACRRISVPLVVHFHGFDIHQHSMLAKHSESYQRLGHGAAAVIAVSHAMVRALDEIGIPKEKIHLVRYGVNPECFKEKSHFSSPPLFFGVGRFVDKKAPYLTVLAFKQVHERFPNARLILGGSGPLLETTRNLALALGLSSSVEFPGILEPKQVASYMQEATAFVQHSLTPEKGPAAGDREGTPVAVLEAMITGLPVVSTRHAGISEVVEHGRTGFLAEERDVDGMAAAMILLASDPDIATSLGRAARAEALGKYTEDHYVGSLHEILESVCG